MTRALKLPLLAIVAIAASGYVGCGVKGDPVPYVEVQSGPQEKSPDQPGSSRSTQSSEHESEVKANP